MTYIALLRGINVGGKNKVPMAELRSLCAELGWSEVRTYIQSGNVVFEADASSADLESQLEQGIEERLGLQVAVIVRSAEEWSAYQQGNPFPDESREEPKLVMLALSKAPPAEDTVAGLQERAAYGERVERVGDALWLHFPEGAGRSKLSPGVFDRNVGSPVTTRNWRTVLKLGEMVDAGE